MGQNVSGKGQNVSGKDQDISTDNSMRIFEKIQYKLVRNGAASKNCGRDVYTAAVITKETYGTRELAARMVKSGCPLNEASIRLVISELAKLIGDLAAEGRAVNIGGVARFMPTICGTFDSPDAPWDPAKHSIKIRACSGSKMRVAAAQCSTSRLKTEPGKKRRK